MTGAAIFVIAVGVTLGLLRFHNTGAPQRSAEWFGDLVFGVVYAAPGVLALIGNRRRPSLLTAAGLALIPLSLSSLAGVTLPLLVPAVVFFVGYSHAHEAGAGKPRNRTLAIVIGSAAVIAAFVSLLAQSRTFCWSEATDADGRTTYASEPCTSALSGGRFAESDRISSSGGMTDGLLTTRGALSALSVLAVGGGVSAWLASPRSSGVPQRH